MPSSLTVSRDDFRDCALELLGGRTLSHDIAEGRVARHLGIAKPPRHAAFRVKPDDALGPLGDPAKYIRTGFQVIGSRISKHYHRGLRSHAFGPLSLEAGERGAVVGRPETDFGHDFAHRVIGALGFQYF